MSFTSTRGALGALLASSLIIACADNGPSVGRGSTDGLKAAVASDSAGNTVPPTTANPRPGPPSDTAGTPPGSNPTPTPGYFRGIVRASEVVNGPDTLNASVRIANVKVSAYPAIFTGAEPETGPLAASVTTNGNGEFQLPELPGGLYVVTFVPPEGSKYQGVWVTAMAHSHSHEYPWWVTLPAK